MPLMGGIRVFLDGVFWQNTACTGVDFAGGVRASCEVRKVGIFGILPARCSTRKQFSKKFPKETDEIFFVVSHAFSNHYSEVRTEIFVQAATPYSKTTLLREDKRTNFRRRNYRRTT